MFPGVNFMSAEFFSQFSLVFPFISLINLNRIICLKALLAFGIILLSIDSNLIPVALQTAEEFVIQILWCKASLKNTQSVILLFPFCENVEFTISLQILKYLGNYHVSQ